MRRILSILIVVALLLSFTACSSRDNDDRAGSKSKKEKAESTQDDDNNSIKKDKKKSGASLHFDDYTYSINIDGKTYNFDFRFSNIVRASDSSSLQKAWEKVTEKANPGEILPDYFYPSFMENAPASLSTGQYNFISAQYLNRAGYIFGYMNVLDDISDFQRIEGKIDNTLVLRFNSQRVGIKFTRLYKDPESYSFWGNENATIIPHDVEHVYFVLKIDEAFEPQNGDLSPELSDGIDVLIAPFKMVMSTKYELPESMKIQVGDAVGAFVSAGNGDSVSFYQANRASLYNLNATVTMTEWIPLDNVIDIVAYDIAKNDFGKYGSGVFPYDDYIVESGFDIPDNCCALSFGTVTIECPKELISSYKENENKNSVLNDIYLSFSMEGVEIYGSENEDDFWENADGGGALALGIFSLVDEVRLAPATGTIIVPLMNAPGRPEMLEQLPYLDNMCYIDQSGTLTIPFYFICLNAYNSDGSPKDALSGDIQTAFGHRFSLPALSVSAEQSKVWSEYNDKVEYRKDDKGRTLSYNSDTNTLKFDDGKGHVWVYAGYDCGWYPESTNDSEIIERK